MLPAALYGQLTQTSAFSDPLGQTLAALAAANTTQAMAPTIGAPGGGQDSSSSTTPTGSKDTTYTKIFVGGLPYHTTDQTLHDYFKVFGEIEEAVVITDRQTQKSRGYGFVTMKERPDAEKACKDPNPIIDGRKANVNLAYLGAKPRNNVQLAALSTGIAAIPLQQQLAAAMMPGRLGLPQLYFPAASQATATAANPLMNQLTQLNPQLVSALQMQQQQQLQAISQAVQAQAIQQQPHTAQANPANSYLNYATLQALAQQQSAAAAAAAQSPNDLSVIQQQFAAAAALQQQQSAASNGSLVYRKEKEKTRISPY